MSNWDAMSIQLVWFTVDARHKDATALYELVTGQQPDTTQNTKNPTASNPFLSVAAGSYEGLVLRATVQVGRIDLVLERELPPDMEIFVPMLIPDTASWIERLAQKAAEASALFSTVNRLAFVVNLGAQIDNYEEGFDLVNTKAGSPFSFDDGTDVMIQVNRRKVIEVGKNTVSINRLLRFAVAGFQRISVHFGGGPAGNPVPDALLATLMLDVNTVPTTREIGAEEQAITWAELAQECLMLREVGSLEGLS